MVQQLIGSSELAPSNQEFSRRRLLRWSAGCAALGCALPGRTLFAGEEDREAKQISENRRLKIASVKTFLLRHKLSRALGASISVPLSPTRETLLVRIQSDSGLVGWGETAPIGGARGAIEQHLAPMLVGRNPLEYRRLWRDMWGANFGNALAVGAVETAINDLRGKALGLSVAELFGGRMRDKVPAYVSALNYVEGREIEEEYPAVAADMVKRGFKAIKMRLGRFSIARESAVAAKVREVVGPSVRLMADGNGAYTPGSALRMGHVLHDLNFHFFEEPLPQAPRYAGYEELRQKMPLPLAAGEVIDSRATAKDLIDRRCMDLIQPDVSLCGGLGEVLFIAEMAALSGIGCIPHAWGGDIVLAASVQLLSIMADPHWGLPTDTPLLELDQSENPWRDGLAVKPLEVQDGSVLVPQGSGLGIEINEEVVKQYAV